MSRVSGRDPLTPDQIVQVALEMIDADGADTFTMRRLAERLGVQPNAIYYYFADKDKLVRAVINHILAECAIPSEGNWQERLRELCRSYRQVALHHPRIFPMMLQEKTMMAQEFILADAFLSILREPLRDKLAAVRAYMLCITYVTGFALEELTGFLTACVDDPSVIYNLPPNEFPHLLDHAEEWFATDLNSDFEFGLDVLIAGFTR